jgi:hypothetical protein
MPLSPWSFTPEFYRTELTSSSAPSQIPTRARNVCWCTGWRRRHGRGVPSVIRLLLSLTLTLPLLSLSRWALGAHRSRTCAFDAPPTSPELVVGTNADLRYCCRRWSWSAWMANSTPGFGFPLAEFRWVHAPARGSSRVHTGLACPLIAVSCSRIGILGSSRAPLYGRRSR